LVIVRAAGFAGDGRRTHPTGAVAHPNRKVRDALPIVLVNLTSVCWLPGMATVRRSSAKELVAILRNHQSQRLELQVRSTTNAVWRTKRPDRFVSIQKVDTF
jgi:hypothetical protein